MSSRFCLTGYGINADEWLPSCCAAHHSAIYTRRWDTNGRYKCLGENFCYT